MPDQTICLKCGAPLADEGRGGFCPKCLFAQATASGFDAPSISGVNPSARESNSIDLTYSSSATDQSLPRPFGDYEILAEIARGGMGVVYRARQVSLDRVVAVKMLLLGPLSSPEFVKRFRAEASAAASLQHPNIVAIHEVGVQQGQQYFAMDYVEGQSLAKLLASGPLPAARAAHYLKIIAEAIHYAHERGILHRDLKPSNVLIDADDQPRVTDFGLARRLESDSELTVTGQLLGSPNYMPPEQAAISRGKVSRRSDVYSLGAMLYHLLTGRPPFVAETLIDTLHQLFNADPVSPRLLNPSVPRDLETICLKCLQKEPEKRYPTAQTLADELGRFHNNEPVHARPITRAERAWRWCRRKPVVASLGAATLVLLLAVAVGSPIAIYRITQARKAEQAQLQRTEEESLKARQFAYASDMNLAYQAVQEDDFYRALQLLDRHRPANTLAESKIHDGKSKIDLRGWEWRYLWRRCQGEERFILGQHSNGATAVGLLADGKTVFSAGRDRFVRLWDLESRRQIGLLPHPEEVIGAAASRDGRWLATTTTKEAEGQPVLLWDLATRKIAAPLTSEFWLRPGSITFSADNRWLAFATIFGGIRIWDVNGRHEITNLSASGTPHGPLGVLFSPDGRSLAYNQNEYGTILFWDVASRSIKGQLTGHKSAVITLAFSPDGRTLASGSDDKSARLWNLANHREGFKFNNRSGGFTSLAFSPDGKTLAMSGEGGAGRVIRRVEVETGSEKAALRGHLKNVSSLAFAPDGQTLLSAGEDGTVRVWELSARPKEKSFESIAPDLSTGWSTYGPSLCLSPDGRHLLTVHTNQTFSVWDTIRLAEGERHALPFTNTLIAAVASGGRLAAFGNWTGEVMLWDGETGQARLFARPVTNRIHRLVFSMDGRYLAAANDTRPFSLEGRYMARADQTKIYSMAALGNETRRAVRVWDVSAGKETDVFPTDGEMPVSLTFSADARTIMAGSWGGLIKVWPVNGPGEPITLVGHSGQVGGLALLPDRKTLISASTDIRFWDVQTRHENAPRLSPRAGAFPCIALSADGRRLAGGGSDGRITIWDVASHQELATLEGHEEAIRQLAFTPDGDHLISVSSDQVRFWRAASRSETDPTRKMESRK